MLNNHRDTAEAIIILLIAFALAAIVINTCGTAEASSTDREPEWLTEIAVRTTALHVSAKVGQTSAAHASCGPAIYHFGKAIKSWNLPTVRTQTRSGWRALRTCNR